MISYVCQDGSQCTYTQILMIGYGEMVLSPDLGCQSYMAPSLASDFITKTE